MEDHSPPFEKSLELLRSAQAGDSRALATVLERYRERLLGRVRMMMGEEARRLMESGDVLQLTFVDVLQGFHRVELADERAFLRWMTTIARNRVRDSVRRKREQSLEAFSDSLARSQPRAKHESPSSAAAAREEVFRLIEALEEVEPKLRAVIEERELDGRTFREVGERLGVSEIQARRLHAKALLRLGRILRPPG